MINTTTAAVQQQQHRNIIRQNKHKKLRPELVVSYDVWCENGEDPILIASAAYIARVSKVLHRKIWFLVMRSKLLDLSWIGVFIMSMLTSLIICYSSFFIDAFTQSWQILFY